LKDLLITFKGVHYPKDIILHAGFSMSGMPFLIATMDKFRRKGGVKSWSCHIQSRGCLLFIFLSFWKS